MGQKKGRPNKTSCLRLPLEVMERNNVDFSSRLSESDLGSTHLSP